MRINFRWFTWHKKKTKKKWKCAIVWKCLFSVKAKDVGLLLHAKSDLRDETNERNIIKWYKQTLKCFSAIISKDTSFHCTTPCRVSSRFIFKKNKQRILDVLLFFVWIARSFVDFVTTNFNNVVPSFGDRETLKLSRKIVWLLCFFFNERLSLCY